MVTGKAYGLFNCGASRQVVEEDLPIIRNVIGVPSSLELRLDEGINALRNNPPLFAFVASLGIPFQYVLTASFPHAPNRETAWHVKDILNQARFGSNMLFPEHEAPEEIVYAVGDRYTLWKPTDAT